MNGRRLTFRGWWVPLIGIVATVAHGQPPADDLRKVAGCIAKKDRVQARALVLSVPGSRDETNRLTALAGVFDACGATSIVELGASNRSLLIGALATPISTTWGEISGRWKGAPDRDKLAKNSAIRTMAYPTNAAVARCLFDTFPDEGEDYVRAKLGSSREARALAKLQSEMSRCVDTGEQIEMTTSQFRAEMVRAYVRYVCAPNDPAPLADPAVREQGDA